MAGKEQLDQYWQRNKKIMVAVLAIWACVSYGAALMAGWLNTVTIFGFPLGYYMGAQGALVVFVVLNYYYARKMNKLDKHYGVAED